MALNIAKASPTALRSAAQSLIEQRKYAEAETYLLEILRRNLNDAPALAAIAAIASETGRHREALTCIMAAINADPSALGYKEQLIEYGGGIPTTDYGVEAEKAITECLKSGEMLDFSRIQTMWANLLTSQPAFNAAFDIANRKPFDPANKAHYEALTDFSALFTSFFLSGIRQVNVSDIRFEEFITHLRKHLFESLCNGKKKFTPEESLALAKALAHYAFRTDYILDVTQEEQSGINGLRKSIEDGKESDAANIALFACYEPLYTLKNVEAIAKTFESSVISDVIRRQVQDYNELKRYAAKVTTITPIDGGVSAQVQEQYEEFPYPQWNLVSQKGLLRAWKGLNAKYINGLTDRKIEILSAGCGTGQETILLSTAFPQANILAVDLSRSSLAYATKKADEYGIKNITFRQGDILRLGTLDRKFDLISSMGVLHHMQDPVKGWQVLCDLLKPGGTMLIALYSKIARKNVLATRDIIKQRGYGHTAAEMMRFRRESPHFLEKDVLADISHWRDYYFMPMYRDLLFHVQEHDYDLLEIEAILAKLGLEFRGFPEKRSVLSQYAKQFPGDPAMTNLCNWHRFEEEKPETFREMYTLWCRKPE